MTHVTGGAPCPGLISRPGQLPRCAAPPSEGGQGDEWAAYSHARHVQRRRTTGSPKGREPYGDGVPVVVAGVTTRQGAGESLEQGEGAQVFSTNRTGRYA